jgi:UDP-glucose:glycoprotein glucosyltransferase
LSVQVVEAFGESVNKAKAGWNSRGYVNEAWKVVRDKTDGIEGLRSMTGLVASKGLPVGCYLMNGQLFKNLDIQQNIMMLLTQEQMHLARKLANGELQEDSKSILGSILVGPTVFKRYHSVLEDDFRSKISTMVLLDSEHKALLSKLSYFRSPATSTDPKPVTLLFLLDLGTPEGLRYLQGALRYLRDPELSASARVAVVPSPSAQDSELAAVVWHLVKTVTDEGLAASEDALQLLEGLLGDYASGAGAAGGSSPSCQKAFAAFIEAAGLTANTAVDTLRAALPGYASSAEQGKELKEAAKRAFKSTVGGGNSLLINGRLLPLIGGGLEPDDIDMMIRVETGEVLEEIDTLVHNDHHEGELPTGDAWSDIVLMIHSFLHSYTSGIARVDVATELARLPGTSLVLDPSQGTIAASSAYNKDDIVLQNMLVCVVLDPLSPTAQRMTPLLTLIRDQLQIPLRILLAPHPEVAEFPLKSYYRFAAFPGRQTSVLFQSLPQQHILTARPDVPEPWNVQTRRVQQDLDNLRCEPQHCGDGDSTHTTAEYFVKNLLIYGQCFDSRAQEAVNGLQLVLRGREGAAAAEGNKTFSDTLVMQNYGYFQLKANPGVWRVQLAQGRAKELYEVVQTAEERGGWERTPSQELLVYKRDFCHHVERLYVGKQPGKEAIPLLDDISKVGPLRKVRDGKGGVALHAQPCLCMSAGGGRRGGGCGCSGGREHVVDHLPGPLRVRHRGRGQGGGEGACVLIGHGPLVRAHAQDHDAERPQEDQRPGQVLAPGELLVAGVQDHGTGDGQRVWV